MSYRMHQAMKETVQHQIDLNPDLSTLADRVAQTCYPMADANPLKTWVKERKIGFILFNEDDQFKVGFCRFNTPGYIDHSVHNWNMAGSTELEVWQDVLDCLGSVIGFETNSFTYALNLKSEQAAHALLDFGFLEQQPAWD